MARMKTGRLTKMTTTPQKGPGGPAKDESSNAGEWAKYDAYVKAKKAYDTDKSEYDARWKRSNEMSRGSISPYHFEDAPAEVKAPELTGRMKIRKAEIASRGELNSGKKNISELSTFNNPKVNVKAGKRVTPGSVVKTANLRSAKPQVDTKAKPFSGYNKEARQFKAYAGTTSKGVDLSKMTSSEIKSYKNVRKEDRRMDRKVGNVAGIVSNTMDIRQARKAERFAKGIEKGGNAIKHFTDKNYGGNIVKDYKESQNNAANRNTMAEKIKKATAKAGSFNGQMPL